MKFNGVAFFLFYMDIIACFRMGESGNFLPFFFKKEGYISIYVFPCFVFQ